MRCLFRTLPPFFPTLPLLGGFSLSILAGIGSGGPRLPVFRTVILKSPWPQETVMSIVWLLIKGREHAMYTCTRAGGGYFSGEKQRLLSAAKILLLGQIYSKGWSSLYSSIMPVPPHAQPSPYEGLRQTCRQWFPHETTWGNSQGVSKTQVHRSCPLPTESDSEVGPRNLCFCRGSPSGLGAVGLRGGI